MSCTKAPIATEVIEQLGPQNILIPISARSLDNRILIVSDNPETLTPTNIPGGVGGALWIHQVSSSTDSVKKYRVYLYHTNNLSGSRNFGILAENTGAAGQSFKIINCKYQASGGPTCIAEATLFHTLDTFVPQNSSFSPGFRGAIWQTTIPQGQAVAGIFEFDVQNLSSTGMSYTLKSIVYPNTINVEQNVLITEDPPNGPPPPTSAEWYGHSRGTWPYASIEIAMTSPYVVDTTSSTARIELSQFQPGPPPVIPPTNLGPDEQLFKAELSLDNPNHAKPNKGLYAVNQHVIITAQNNDTADHVVTARLWAIRPDPHPDKPSILWDGAASGTSVYQGSYHSVVPIIKPTAPNPNAARILDFLVPAGQQSSTSFLVHTGGGSSLPIGVHLSFDQGPPP